MCKTSKSPYLSEANRLADVIAAIQAMGTYKFYKLDFAGWSKRISGTSSNSEYWKKIIEEHPEFFRLDNKGKRASLVWRRNYQRTYHVDKNEILSREQCEILSEEERSSRISRVPLSNDDISVLINTAINLHNRALEKEKASRWWFTPIVGLLGVILGAAIQAYF